MGRMRCGEHKRHAWSATLTCTRCGRQRAPDAGPLGGRRSIGVSRAAIGSAWSERSGGHSMSGAAINKWFGGGGGGAV